MLKNIHAYCVTNVMSAAQSTKRIFLTDTVEIFIDRVLRKNYTIVEENSWNY